MALSNGGSTYQFSDGNLDAAKSLGGTTLLSATGAGLYFLDTAVTANVTTTTVSAGSIGVTTNATGVGAMFISDGAKWQFAVVA
jgi:hypothetical protein|tara:strand:+ start:596 stop:847 length:252 start_codon:yes stop_codon:yes gene_type:complete